MVRRGCQLPMHGSRSFVDTTSSRTVAKGRAQLVSRPTEASSRPEYPTKSVASAMSPWRERRRRSVGSTPRWQQYWLWERWTAQKFNFPKILFRRPAQERPNGVQLSQSESFVETTRKRLIAHHATREQLVKKLEESEARLERLRVWQPVSAISASRLGKPGAESPANGEPASGGTRSLAQELQAGALV